MKRHNFLKIIVFLLSSLLVLTACSGEPDEHDTETSGSFSYVFTDDTGETVTLTKRPQKVAVLFSSYAEIWTLAGGNVDITVAESIDRGFADSSALIIADGAGHDVINLELLIASEPDFVIGTADFEGQSEAVKFCRSVGIPSAAFKVEGFEDYLRVLKIFCDITDKPDNYVRYGVSVSDDIEKIKQKASEYLLGNEKTSILFIRAGSSARSTKAKTAADNYVCAMLDELGAANIADGTKLVGGELSLEVIIERSPEIMFISTMGDENAAKDFFESLLCGDGYKDLECVKNGRYFYLPRELFHFKPNSRWAESYKYLAKILYPEIELD